MKKLYIDWHPKHATVALVEDGKLVELLHERDTTPKLVGSIFKGRVENTLKGMMAAFVNIGLDKNAYLNVGESLVDMSKLTDGGIVEGPAKLNVAAGDVIMCQVVKDHFGNKGVRVSMDISLPGRYVVLIPNNEFFGISRKIEDADKRAYLEKLMRDNSQPNMGFIARTLAVKASDEEIIAEMKELLKIWEVILAAYKKAPVKTKVYSEGDLVLRALRDLLSYDLDELVVNNSDLLEQIRTEFEVKGIPTDILTLYEGDEFFLAHYGILDKIDSDMSRRYDLENGGYLNFDKTEALTVIDVNTGKFVGEVGLQDTVFKTNLAAAEEIARLIRLRNIGGIIIVDFIDMKSQEHKDAVVAKLAEEVKKDRIKTAVVDMTPLGLVEITRKKERAFINDMFRMGCPHCGGAGYVYVDEIVIVQIRESLLKHFSNPKNQEAVIYANSAIIQQMLDMNIHERELMNAWRDKIIYIVEDESLDRSMFGFTGGGELTDEQKSHLRTL